MLKIAHIVKYCVEAHKETDIATRFSQLVETRLEKFIEAQLAMLYARERPEFLDTDRITFQIIADDDFPDSRRVLVWFDNRKRLLHFMVTAAIGSDGRFCITNTLLPLGQRNDTTHDGFKVIANQPDPDYCTFGWKKIIDGDTYGDYIICESADVDRDFENYKELVLEHAREYIKQLRGEH